MPDIVKLCFTIEPGEGVGAMLSMPRLRMLAELERLGTVTAVARELAYSASAVSQQLALLEKEAGVVLLERTGRRLRLTDAGLGLAGHARSLLEGLERAESELASARSPVSGELAVASFQTPLLSIAPSALSDLAVRHPELRVRMTQRELDEAYEGLLSHTFDVIVGEEFPGVHEAVRGGVHREDLLADPLLLVLPVDEPWSRPRRLGDLARAPWALDPEDTPTGLWGRSTLRNAGFEPDIRFVSSDPLVQAHLVRAGHAAALIPALIARQHLGGTTLRVLPGAPRRRIYTAVRAGRTGHPSIVAFRHALASAVREVELTTDAEEIPL